MNHPDYYSIITHYEACLEKHGDTHRGVDWPNKAHAQVRYRVMLDLIRPSEETTPVQLLDFGCGASHLYEYLLAHDTTGVYYSGLDASEKFIQLSRRKFPENRYFMMDLLVSDKSLPHFDYIIMNGVFTEKRSLGFDAMFSYFQRLLKKAFAYADSGLAFNVMSKHVDWERAELFHLPFDLLAAFLTKEITRNFVFRNDYGLYEYTTYIYR